MSHMRIRFRIKEVATEKGFTQGGLSRAAFVDKKTVQRVYRDPYRDISASTLIKFAYVLEVKTDELFTLEETNEPRHWH